MAMEPDLSIGDLTDEGLIGLNPAITLQIWKIKLSNTRSSSLYVEGTVNTFDPNLSWLGTWKMNPHWTREETHVHALLYDKDKVLTTVKRPNKCSQK